MGAHNSSNNQPTINISSLTKGYQIVQKNQDQLFTIIKQKQSEIFFIIKQLIFVQKSFFQKNLCRFNHFQQREQSQNILNLRKVWTEEHSTLCSNTYKIFPMYEYSNVTLDDEMEARKTESKHFQEDQILGMIQSCVNALNSQPPMLISPSQYFIYQDGLLKLNNRDLFNSQKLDSYTKGVYYSYQKMQNFDDDSFYCNDQIYMRQSIFSLGITLLSCIYLQDVGDKIYNPLNANKKMRLNINQLQSLIKSINSRNTKYLSEKLVQLIKKMIHQDPKLRPTIIQIQDQLDSIVKIKQSRIEIQEEEEVSTDEAQRVQKVKQIEFDHSQKQNKLPLFNGQNLSTIEDKKIMNLNSLRSKQLSDSSELDILRQFQTGSGKSRKIGYVPYHVPLVLSAQIMNQSKQLINQNQNQQILPSPISKQNPLFTNPQFLAKINEDIKQFSFKRKNSFASTDFSRKNSNLVVLCERAVNQNVNFVNLY